VSYLILNLLLQPAFFDIVDLLQTELTVPSNIEKTL